MSKCIVSMKTIKLSRFATLAILTLGLSSVGTSPTRAGHTANNSFQCGNAPRIAQATTGTYVLYIKESDGQGGFRDRWSVLARGSYEFLDNYRQGWVRDGFPTKIEYEEN